MTQRARRTRLERISALNEKNGRPPNGLLFDEAGARGCWSSFALFNFVAPFILKRKRKEGGEAKKKKKKNRRIPIKLERVSI